MSYLLYIYLTFRYSKEESQAEETIPRADLDLKIDVWREF